MSTTDFLVSSLPTIKIAGRTDASLAQGLLALSVHEHIDGLADCELQVGNWGLSNDATDFLYFDRRTLDFGKSIEVSLGETPLFKGKISGLEAGYPQSSVPVLTVLAEDRLQDLRMTRRTRTFAEASDADVMRQIANDHGLTPSIEASGPTHKVLAQVAQSDLAFLRARARALNVELWITDSTLHVAPRASRPGGTPVKLGYARELREFTVLADLADQRSSVTVTGWDPAAKKAISETADDGDLGGEAAGGDTGASILGSAFAQRKETIVVDVPLTVADAQARAKAHFTRRARRFVTARGLADTQPGLRVGAKVKVVGVGPLFEGEYYVTETRHLFDAAFGLRTEFMVERSWLGRAA